MASPTIVIIGAGVFGLSCAVNLQAKLAEEDALVRHELVVVACEWPSPTIPGLSSPSVNYASMWAGAHVRPIPATTPQLQREAKWLKHTVAEFERQMEAEPFCGITRTGGIEYMEEPSAGYSNQDSSTFEQESGLRGYGQIAGCELPEGVALGFRYETFCINPSVYCEHLLRKFLLRGGKAKTRHLSSEWDPYSALDQVVLVINASGFGFGDPQCFPTRGQTVLTDLSVAYTITRQHRDGTKSFLVPRSFCGGTVVGGTTEVRDWRDAPDAATRDRLLASGLAMAGSHGQVKVVGDIVGRRPTRTDGLRLDVEERSRTERVIHAYGAGGRGYEMSWGVANEVTQLAIPLLR
ncbi:hypothetical protein XA68_13681 [Ophiocordyceps unilateralis]|uniref:FAD dependent oxidoreductase domain-containing protein n=1 Tax=Ophiocordyceps unilateralis TaxID=268505 RepID=A0A2A9PC39_OPHUN|nr:hypothetical protein XA68_13681 [Ophiocordyceps unilateralis]